MRLRDDLELLIEPDGQIQVRSISRFGYRRHGVNRARAEALRVPPPTQPTDGQRDRTHGNKKPRAMSSRGAWMSGSINRRTGA